MYLITIARRVAPPEGFCVTPFLVLHCIHLLSCQMYFQYIAGSSFATCSAIVPSITICTHSFISTCKKAPWMSVTTKHCPYFASMQHDIIMASSDTIGGLASSISVYCLCGLPSVHPLTLTASSLFSLINIKYLKALFVSSV